MTTHNTTTVNGIEFKLCDDGFNFYIVSKFDTTPIYVDTVVYNERDSKSTIELEDATYGLIDEMGAETASDTIEEAIEYFEMYI